MRFACEQCKTKYTIADDRVRGKILKIRCKTCGCLITVSEGGVRTARIAEPAAGDSTIAGLPGELEEGGDSTMIGGMADFFGPGGAKAPPAPDEWYLSIDGVNNGPIPLIDLAQRVVVEEKNPARELFVWREGFTDWLAPAENEEVNAAVKKARLLPLPKPAPVAAKPAPMYVPVLPAADEGEGDATVVGGLAPPSGPPASARGPATPAVEDPSDAALETVETFETVTDLPAPPKPGTKPMAGADKPKGPPAFRPPPVPGSKPPGPMPALPKPPIPAALTTSQPPPRSNPEVNMGAAASPFAGDSAVSNAPTTSAPPVYASTGMSSGSGYPPASGQGSSPAYSPVGMGSSPAYPAPGAGMGMGGMGMGMGMTPDGMAQSPPDAGAQDPALNLRSGFRPKLPILVGAGGVLLVITVIAILVSRPPKRPPLPVDTKPDAGAVAAVNDAEIKKANAKKEEKKPEDLGGLTPADRDELFEKNAKALASCYKKALKKDESLAGTKVAVTVDISAKGKASEVTLKGTDEESKLGKCLQKTVKRWKFAKGKEFVGKFTLTVTAPEE